MLLKAEKRKPRLGKRKHATAVHTFSRNDQHLTPSADTHTPTFTQYITTLSFSHCERERESVACVLSELQAAIRKLNTQGKYIGAGARSEN